MEADMGEHRKREYPFLTDQSLDRAFGPPCTIGLEFEAAQDFTLPQHEYDIDVNDVRQPFLWSGYCERGTRFMIRLSHPTSAGDQSVVPGLYHLVELRLADELAIRFSTSDQRSDRYTVECSAAFLPGFAAAPEDRNIQIAECSRELTDVLPTDGVVDKADANAIVASAAQRIRELLKEVLTGYFYLSAIRQSHLYSQLEDATTDENLDLQALIGARHVGPQGEATWWLERKFAYNPMAPVIDSQAREPTNETPLFEEYVSRWSETLLQTSIDYSRPLHSPWADSPIGFLIDPRPLPVEKEFTRTLDEGDLARLLHPCFENEPQLPKQMSSGFHQLMPLIVQTGLMRQHEIMAVENPEVHLHPRLQLQVAEFLMRQANFGKWIIIETHSDLIIRRVIREILEESIAIGQSKIGIYFASVDKSEEGYHYSTLEPIKIDERTGRVANWPPGFMDDDVIESRRLLDVMYPPSDIAEDDE
ncbi:MAG TPA: AAA family ATPase [Lacipirellulaceae bacterium]|nr:AAA family ATPase [Lacipirellulaceae bacterium]